MEHVVSTNEWGQLVHHRHAAVVELRWHRQGAPMTDAGFMATLCLLALHAERLCPIGMLIDATDFAHQFGDGVMAWRNQAVIPRYGAAGVRRFAFILPAGASAIGREAVEHPAVFPTAWFGNRDDAMRWLTAPQT